MRTAILLVMNFMSEINYVGFFHSKSCVVALYLCYITTLIIIKTYNIR